MHEGLDIWTKVTPVLLNFQFKETTKTSRKKAKQLSVFVSATERIPVISTVSQLQIWQLILYVVSSLCSVQNME